MESLLTFGIVWTVYGAIGLLFGWQVIPKEHKGKAWTVEYIRFRALCWILMGVPWLILYFVFKSVELSFPEYAALLITAAFPGILYSFKQEKKYKKLLNEQKESL